MNDVTFGATLLFLFALLVVAVGVEVTAITPRGGPLPVVAEATADSALVAKTKDCTRVAQAPAP